jgi:hypothetical protein
MTDQKIRSATIPAPYLPFKTFLSSLDPFSQGIPPKIDRSLWNQSGFVQGLIMNAYRFFHMIDLSDKPTTAFQQLVTAKNEDRKARIVQLLEIGYPEIMAHELATMTPKMLDSLMEEYNVNGETKKKAVTFFLQAAKHAGVPLSNFLTERIRSTGGVKRRRKSEDVTDNRIQGPASIHGSHGSSRSVTLAEGGTVTLTISVDVFSLGKDDREFVFGLIDQLQKYEAEHPSDDDEEESEGDGQV